MKKNHLFEHIFANVLLLFSNNFVNVFNLNRSFLLLAQALKRCTCFFFFLKKNMVVSEDKKYNNFSNSEDECVLVVKNVKESLLSSFFIVSRVDCTYVLSRNSKSIFEISHRFKGLNLLVLTSLSGNFYHLAFKHVAKNQDCSVYVLQYSRDSKHFLTCEWLSSKTMAHLSKRGFSPIPNISMPFSSLPLHELRAFSHTYSDVFSPRTL